MHPRRLSLLCSVLALGALTPVTGLANNLILNGSFENGTYQPQGHTNPNVPVDWTSNDGFDFSSSWDQARFWGGSAYDGSYVLSIGNDDGNPVPALSQSFNDVAGSPYSVLFALWYGGFGSGDTAVFSDVTVTDSANTVLGSDHFNYQTPNGWHLYDFTFTGSGHDTLTIDGNTSPSEWFYDAVQVNGLSPSGVPDAASTGVLLTLCSGALAAFSRRKQRA